MLIRFEVGFLLYILTETCFDYWFGLVTKIQCIFADYLFSLCFIKAFSSNEENTKKRKAKNNHKQGRCVLSGSKEEGGFQIAETM